MEILFLSYSYKTTHRILIQGINECLEKNKFKVSKEFNPSAKYDCILVFNRKSLMQHEEFLKTTKVPVIYLFCLSDMVKEYSISDTTVQTVIFKDKMLNLQHLSSAPLYYQDMILPAKPCHEEYVNKNENVRIDKKPQIYVHIDDEYYGDLVLLKILPLLNQLYNYDIYCKSSEGINRHLINKHIKLIKNEQDITERLDASDVVIASGFVAYEAIMRGKKAIIVGEKGYGGLVTDANLTYHLSCFFQGRNGGKFDEYIPLLLLGKAIEDEQPDRCKIIENIAVLQTQSEKKFISLIEKVSYYSEKILPDGASVNYILNPDYEITKKKSRIWLSERVFNKLCKPVNESEAVVIFSFREPATVQSVLNKFPPEYATDINEYICELISEKIIFPVSY